MKLTRCMHGHFYDGSKFSACPQCVEKGYIAVSGQGEAELEENETPDNAGFGGDYIHVKAMEEQPAHSIHPADAVPAASGSYDIKTTDFIGGFWGEAEAEKRLAENVEKPEQEPEPLPQEQKDEEPSEEWETKDEGCLRTEALTDEEQGSERKQEMLPVQTGTSPLQQEVEKAGASVTDPFEDTKTVAFFNGLPSEPVVGWLVALGGAYAGQSFPLKTGQNAVGRWPKMDVALTQEPSVSRNRHAVVIYEPRKRVFYIQPGESNGLTYVNDELLLAPAPLADGSVVQLGDCRLLFKALCGEEFSWDSLI